MAVRRKTCAARSKQRTCAMRISIFSISSCFVFGAQYTSSKSFHEVIGCNLKDAIYKMPKLSRLKQYQQQKLQKVKDALKKTHGPKSLAALCGQVIKKHKLIAPPEPKKFTPPETFTVVGGKPLRKRSERQNKEEVVKKESRRSSPKSLAVLCQIVIEEYNLLPQTEESSLPISNLISTDTSRRKRSRSQVDGAEKRPRGRPRKPVQELQAEQQKTKRPRGRPRKDSGKIEQPKESEEEPINYTYVRIKEETDSLPDVDPLQDGEDEEDFTVEIKLESRDSEDDEITPKTPAIPSSQTIDISQAMAGSSKTGVTQMPQFVTVVMDEYQRFANRIAEQLREFPPRTALLLQKGIQAMIDNERQLMDEN